MAENNDLDRRIIGLLSKRAGELIGGFKAKAGSPDIFDPGERDAIFRAVEECSAGPLSAEFMKKLYTDLLSFCMDSVMPVRVAYLGPEGTFANIALKEVFGDYAKELPQKTISDVFREVESGSASFGVVPIENSTEGAVTYTMDELLETSLRIISEKYVRISLCLVSLSEDPDKIKKVYSHPQPLGQCKGWLKNNLPNADVQGVDSTSEAARLAMGDPETAAVASHLAAKIYGLNIIESGIEDVRQNFTRFFIMGERDNAPTGEDKTSIVCAVKDSPGALLGLLTPFSSAGINMTRIESRPDKKKMWAYNFFIDFIGHKDDRVVVGALEEMKNETLFLKILGSYPIGS
ncbi:MAG: prephenate dehydratase [Spirochaetes bacterium]|jgi:chorismate mutase/prephenate dehydratase|nr:prephenate dehydratase [Spirochaetota bacterium]